MIDTKIAILVIDIRYIPFKYGSEFEGIVDKRLYFWLVTFHVSLPTFTYVYQIWVMFTIIIYNTN